MLRFDLLTLFPDMFVGPFHESIIDRAQSKKLIEIKLHNLRDYTHDVHRTVDDTPFGGGPGMVLKPEPLFEAISSLNSNKTKVIALTPTGEKLSQLMVRELAKESHLVLVCGRYEGFDERFLTEAVDLEVSIGDFVVSGGELPAMIMVDAISRQVAGVLGSAESLEEESFNDLGLLEYPQYTRPAVFDNQHVPEVLLSGNHERIRMWRQYKSLKRTIERRPDLLPDINKSKTDLDVLAQRMSVEDLNESM
ncbi:MAG: tRNA (guanosine(37)-N1)-methyltransferase TrmD [Dehalococcoidia bacterium]|nr:tRNA (guanosine(37)-N1)-methyltransferase TrmD [Dehalococcoidia bacterium]